MSTPKADRGVGGAGPLVVRGDIVTMDPGRPRVEALGIVEGRVVAAGTRDEALGSVPAGTPELELPGTVVPGLIDSHVHMSWGGRGTEELEVGDAVSVSEVLARLREFAAANPEREWLAGRAGIDPESLAEGRFPTAAELDEAAGGRPVFLDRRSHDALVSSGALRAAGVGAGTADPPGGVIERDAAGEPTGFLIERPAAELVERAMPAPSLEDRLRRLRAIQPRFVAAGITGVVDPALEAEEMLAYAAAAERGELSLRVTGMPLGDGEVPPAERAAAFAAAGVDLANRDGDFWRIGPWKLFLDGGGSLGTALLYEPWPGTDGYRGNQTTSTAGLNEYAEWAAATGAGLGVHCVGSAAIDLFIAACARAAAVRPLRGLGFTAIHAYLWPAAEQMARIRDLDVLVATQSPLQYTFGPGLVRRFGAEAIGRAHPMRSWLESGAVVGGGSDGTGHGVEAPIAPLWAFWQMRTRSIEGRDEPVGPQEAITAEQALALYTTGAAAVAMAPDRGKLAPGHVADLAALEVDPLAATPEQCRNAAVLATMVAGDLVHDAR
ncbi:MAG TPA: amidohydrolase [Solirubrobacterales bacterium]|nr:amidohydrolase [Solirubrobacterales bacterium]